MPCERLLEDEKKTNYSRIYLLTMYMIKVKYPKHAKKPQSSITMYLISNKKRAKHMNKYFTVKHKEIVN